MAPVEESKDLTDNENNLSFICILIRQDEEYPQGNVRDEIAL